MEIDITDFVTGADPFKFSASMAERGANAGWETWNNAKEYAADSPLLDTPEKLEAMREWAKETGAWNAEERAAWSEEKINAMCLSA
jgi:hypothetical protein